MTKEHFQEMLIAEREWRIKELSFSKKISFLYLHPSFRKHIPTYWKFCVPMIYSHWEGFVVAAIRLVIDYINNLQIAYNFVPQYLIRLENKRRFSYLQGNCTFEQQDRFLSEFIAAQSQGIKIQNTTITANSNLNYSQLERMLFYLNLLSSPIIASNRDIIEKLVWWRNSIAHGENCITVTQTDIEAFISAEMICFDEIIQILVQYIDDLHAQINIL